MSTIINGTSSAITFPDSSVQNTSAIVSGYVPYANLPAGSVLQCVSVTKSDIFSTATTGSWVDVTGLSLSITPKFATSKVLVIYSLCGVSNNDQAFMQLIRGSTPISVGDAAGSRLQVSSGNIYNASASAFTQNTGTYLDSPATTSATTYKLAVRSNAATIFVNSSSGDTNTNGQGRTVSSITLMEIAA